MIRPELHSTCNANMIQRVGPNVNTMFASYAERKVDAHKQIMVTLWFIKTVVLARHSVA